MYKIGGRPVWEWGCGVCVCRGGLGWSTQDVNIVKYNGCLKGLLVDTKITQSSGKKLSPKASNQQSVTV